MEDKEQLKQRVCDTIDSCAESVIGLGEDILRHPETGFREQRTAGVVADAFKALGLVPETGLALTGVKARLPGGNEGPNLAILGELDSLCIPDHPHADPDTGAAHACGHNAQLAGMLGAARGLIQSGVAKELGGNLSFFAVPAEEMIEVGYRMGLREAGTIEFMTGKSELIRLGHFDDVDLAMMCHTKNDTTPSNMANSSNGAIIKKIRFIGRAAHAGSSPQKGINALNAANLAMTAIAFQRETFYDNDTIRIHPIITKGGDAVSAVPSEVILETFVRGRTLEGIVDANRKVERAVRGAAMAIGADVEIETTPGYLPQRNNAAMAAHWGANVERLYGPDSFRVEEHRTGSTDMGDLGHIMPVIHPYIYGASGVGHGNDYLMASPQDVYVNMAKLLAMTAVDLMSGDAGQAREIVDGQRPKLTKDEYLTFCRELAASERFADSDGSTAA